MANPSLRVAMLVCAMPSPGQSSLISSVASLGHSVPSHIVSMQGRSIATPIRSRSVAYHVCANPLPVIASPLQHHASRLCAPPLPCRSLLDSASPLHCASLQCFATAHPRPTLALHPTAAPDYAVASQRRAFPLQIESMLCRCRSLLCNAIATLSPCHSITLLC